MRLLNARTLEFEEFLGKNIPPYAILSHTWEEEEVTYQDIVLQRERAEQKKGFQKILGCVRTATEYGIDYVWIDTCNIDKSSSAELTEAINSMFHWYKRAEMCFVYLPDGPLSYCTDGNMDPAGDSKLRRCRWFTRGWTLQELIAPTEVMFFSASWDFIGSKLFLLKPLSTITGVSEEILQSCDPSNASIAQRMSWVSRRETTREEDIAYCMLGIFDVNMPLLYGEGPKSFIRLQEEIMRTSDDHSIFAWKDPASSWFSHRGLLATSPSMFKDAEKIESKEFYPSTPYGMTNTGLQISLPCVESEDDPEEFLAVMNCSAVEGSSLAIRLRRTGPGSGQCLRIEPYDLAHVPSSIAEPQSFYVRQNGFGPQVSLGRLKGMCIQAPVVWPNAQRSLTIHKKGLRTWPPAEDDDFLENLRLVRSSVTRTGKIEEFRILGDHSFYRDYRPLVILEFNANTAAPQYSEHAEKYLLPNEYTATIYTVSPTYDVVKAPVASDSPRNYPNVFSQELNIQMTPKTIGDEIFILTTITVNR